MKKTIFFMRTKYRRKLSRNRNLPPWWPAFMVLDATVQAAEGTKVPMIFPNCKPYELQYQPARKNGQIVAKVANRLIQQEGIHC